MSRLGPWVVVLAGLVLVAGCTSGPPRPAPAVGPVRVEAASPVPITSAGPAVLAVKIDNVDAARPATGLSTAQVIYVEPVEAGLTRIVAVFGAKRPDVVGPVRSARETDLDLVPQFGRPTFAYSGSVPQIQPLIDAASMINASQANVPNAYFRGAARAEPHNLYLRPAKLPVGTPPAQPVFTYGPAPAGGTPTTDQKVRYPGASYEFRWSAGKWQVWLDGTPFTSTEAGQLGAATVVIQRVATHPEPFAEDSSGAVAPVAQTIGTGTATVLLGGRAYLATWSRSGVPAPTTFTVGGRRLSFATGQIWILLVPAN